MVEARQVRAYLLQQPPQPACQAILVFWACQSSSTYVSLAPMPARRWSEELVYVLVPEEGAVDQKVRAAARTACRVALLRDMTPICPILYYEPFITPEERSVKLPRLAMKWYRRCWSIWLQFPTPDEELDRLSYRMLDQNERCTYAQRRPVYRLEENEDDIIPVPLSRAEIRQILDCNIHSGLAVNCI
jgi:hypothetical protein